jgi:hypothetical protein
MKRGLPVNHHADCDCPDHDHSAEAGTLAYAGYGVRFQYPRNWTLTEETGPDQTTITVQSPETSYWTLSLFQDRPDPERIVESVMEAYQSLYEDLDVYEPEAQVLGFPAITRELDFVCLDLVNTAAMIAFQAIDQSVLVIFQGEDRELESTRPVMEAITRTLLCDMDGDSVADDVSDNASVEYGTGPQ